MAQRKTEPRNRTKPVRKLARPKPGKVVQKKGLKKWQAVLGSAGILAAGFFGLRFAIRKYSD